jgi:hypothetical protein
MRNRGRPGGLDVLQKGGTMGKYEMQKELEAAREIAQRFAKPGETIAVTGESHNGHSDVWEITKRPDGKLDPNVGKIYMPD